MRNHYLILLLLVLSFSCLAQTNTASFDETKLLERIKTLSSDKFEGRKTGQKGSQLARTFIIEEFKALGAKPFNNKYEHRFNFTSGASTYEGVNILALIPGTIDKDTHIVVSAHYDHLGIKNGDIYNGADDDASGVAALFSFAEYLTKNPPKHSVILAAFDAEEMGLKGATYFVDKMKSHTIMANLNMDMISRSAKNELYVVGARYTKSLKTLLTNFRNPTDTKLLQGHDGSDGKEDWTQSSDHAPFYKAKIPFLYFGDEDHPGYHNPSDDFEKITPEFYKNSVRIILSIFTELDNSSEL
jgi:Zn-dependent M28 family amino/carboxypeptidase